MQRILVANGFHMAGTWAGDAGFDPLTISGFLDVSYSCLLCNTYNTTWHVPDVTIREIDPRDSDCLCDASMCSIQTGPLAA